MTRFWPPLIFVAVVAACPGQPPPQPPPDSIVCAGACGIGEPCDSNDDCVFGTCSGTVCSVPLDGPAPTGPVSAIFTPAGGLVTVVTDERVQMELDLPAGAVRGDVPLTLAPRTPTDGGLMDIEVSVGGVTFLVPITVRVTLPPGVSFGSDVWSRFAGSEGEIIPIARSVEGTSSLQWQTSMFGNGNVFVPPLPAALTDDYWEKMSLQIVKMPLDQVLPALQQLLDSLLREGRAADAAALQGILGRMLTDAVTKDEPSFITFLNNAQTSTCAGLTTVVNDLPSRRIECINDMAIAAENAASFAVVLQAMGSAVGATCPALLTWDEALSSREGALIQSLEQSLLTAGGQRDYYGCECQAPPERRPSKCAALGFLANLQPDEWDFLLEDAQRVRYAYDILLVLGLSTEAQSLAEGIVAPLHEIYRGLAFDECVDGGDMSYLGMLAPLMTDAAPLVADAQHCASALTATVKDGQGNTLETASVARTAAPGERPAALPLTPVRGSTVELRGPIGTLLCRAAPSAAETILDDVIRLDLVHPNGTVVASDTRQANQARTLLDGTGGFDVDVDTVLAALGIGVNDSPAFSLRLVRRSSACGDIYDGEHTLFELDLASRNATFTVLARTMYSAVVINPGLSHCTLAGPTAPAGLPLAVDTGCGLALAMVETAPQVVDITSAIDVDGSPQIVGDLRVDLPVERRIRITHVLGNPNLTPSAPNPGDAQVTTLLRRDATFGADGTVQPGPYVQGCVALAPVSSCPGDVNAPTVDEVFPAGTHAVTVVFQASGIEHATWSDGSVRVEILPP